MKWIHGEFEKKFDVYATNKIIGMQILTADIMEMLVQFKNTSNINFEVFINCQEIYIRFHCGEMFEAPRLKKGLFDEPTLRKYYNIIEFTYSLSNKLTKTIDEVEI